MCIVHQNETQTHYDAMNLFTRIYLQCMMALSICILLCQKRASDGCKPPCGSWELNLGPLSHLSRHDTLK